MESQFNVEEAAHLVQDIALPLVTLLLTEIKQTILNSYEIR